jgi:hypothetical protein
MLYTFKIVIDDSVLNVNSIGRIHSELHKSLIGHIAALKDRDKNIEINRTTQFKPDYIIAFTVEENTTPREKCKCCGKDDRHKEDYCSRYCCTDGKGQSFDIENGYCTEYCACQIKRNETAFMKAIIEEKYKSQCDTSNFYKHFKLVEDPEK